MKSLLEEWDCFVDLFLQKVKDHPRLWVGEISRNEAESYLSFYCLNGGLFIESTQNELCGIMTMHPGSKDCDWVWDAKSDCYTVNICWAKHKKALKSLMFNGLNRFLPKAVYYTRGGRVFHLTPKKVERLAKYEFRG